MSNGAATTLPSISKKMQTRSDRKRKAAKAQQLHSSHEVQDAPVDDTTKPSSAFADKKNIMWVLLSGAMALTFVVMLFLPDTGMGTGLLSTYAAMLWCGFFGAALWRYRSGSGWAGFAYGSVIGFVVQFASQLI